MNTDEKTIIENHINISPPETSTTLKKKGFQKGISGNPHGRPKTTQQQKNTLELIKSLAPEAARTLAKIVKSDDCNASDRIRACEIILDRTYGKAPSTVVVENTNNDIVNDIRKELEKVKRGIVITSGNVE